MKQRIAIIGGGPTGIATAYYLARSGHSVHLFEKSDRLGGLVGYFTIGGCEVERYYHFIMTHDRHYLQLLDDFGVADQLNWVETKTNFFARGRLYDFTSPFDLLRFSPVGLVGRLRFLVTMAYLSKISRDWRPFERRLACEWLPRRCGRQVWDVILNPMFRMKFGSHADEMSMAWFWARTRMISQYREKGVSKEKRAWLKGSSRTFVEAAERAIGELGGRISCRSRVEQILVENGTCRGIRADGETLSFDKVAYCAPSVFLNDLLQPSAFSLQPYFETIRTHRYYTVVCLVIALDRPLSDYFWTYVSDARIPFVGVINYTPFTSWPGHEGHHVLYIPWYCETHEPPYTTDDEQIFRDYVAGLRCVWPALNESWVKEWRVLRDVHASMICKGEYSRQIVGIQTPIAGLYFANMSQIYPQDRGISVGVGLAKQAVEVIETGRDILPEFAP